MIPARLILLVGLLCTVSSAQEPPPPLEEAPEREAAVVSVDAPRQRVVVRVDRNLEVAGHVELEDDDVLVVRGLDDKLHSFFKTRLSRVTVLTDPAPGQKGLVILRNGQTAQGAILEDSFERVVVEIEKIPVTFRRSVVDHVRLEPTVEERYEHYKDDIGIDTPGKHLTLCQWLIEEHRYELARIELEELTVRRPDITEARRLLGLVDAQLRLEAPGRTAAKTTQDHPENPVMTSRPHSTSPPSAQLLTRADVNLIRAYEIDFRNPPRVMVNADTISALLERYATSDDLPPTPEGRKALYRAEPMRVVELMFRMRARDLYPRIEVLSEPRALNLFRRRVHNTWLINTCATDRCHGGPGAGRLWLHNQRYRDERVVYTNLLILERLELDPEWPLINYHTPMDSMLIQHALPREVARKPHPDVRGWGPIFVRTEHRALRATVAWIDAMMRPRPDYPLELQLATPQVVQKDPALLETPEERTPR